MDIGQLTYSARRNKATVMDVLPAPVLPTMPIFSPPLLWKDLGEFSIVSPDDTRLLTFLSVPLGVQVDTTWKHSRTRPGLQQATNAQGRNHQ
jgi:hypothetical protein